MSRGADWIHPPTRFAIMWFRDGGVCHVCGWKPTEPFGEGLTLDHLIPTSRWTSEAGVRAACCPIARSPHHPTNLVTLCKACNDRKWRALPGEVFAPAIVRQLWARAGRPLTARHRARGYALALRLGRYRLEANAAKCRARRARAVADRAYEREERAGIVADTLGRGA